MKIQITNCLKCPFSIEDANFNSIGKEICISCNLLKFLSLEQIEKHKFRYFDYKKWTEMEYLEPLEHCPLKINPKIEINYEN